MPPQKKQKSALRRWWKRVRLALRGGDKRPPTSPEAVLARWRSLSAPALPPEHFEDVGLDNVWTRYPGKFDRQVIAIQCLRSVCEAGVKGEIIEFGCYNGHTAIQIVQTLRALGDTSRVLLLDSFEGMPDSDHELDSYWRTGSLKADYDSVKARFTAFPNVEVVKGYFHDTLPAYGDLQVKFAHVDCDMYRSVRDVHEWLLDRVVEGGAIVYDDYGFESCEGLMKAVDEDMAERDDYLKLSLPTGQYVAVRRRPAR